MALESNEPKKLTRQQIIDKAVELDLRRQEQIANQAKIINRLTDEIMIAEAYLGRIAAGQTADAFGDAKGVAQEGLDEMDKKRAEHRAKNREKKDD